MAETRTYVATVRVCWLGYADQSRGPARRLLLLPYTTTTHRQHQQQFLRHPNSTYEILQLNPSRKLGMFSVGDGAPSEKRKARYCVGPGAAAYDWKCPSRARSEAPPAHYVVHCGALWCTVVQCGAVWCTVVPCGAVWCRNQRYCVGDCLLLCPCVCSGICRLFAGIDCEIL